MLLDKIIRKHKLKVDETLVKVLIEEIGSTYKDPKVIIELYRKNKELMNNMRNMALEEQAIEAFFANVLVMEKETSLIELINQLSAA